jgi:hypothetical protein
VNHSLRNSEVRGSDAFVEAHQTLGRDTEHLSKYINLGTLQSSIGSEELWYTVIFHTLHGTDGSGCSSMVQSDETHNQITGVYVVTDC